MLFFKMYFILEKLYVGFSIVMALLYNSQIRTLYHKAFRKDPQRTTLGKSPKYVFLIKQNCMNLA